MKVPKVIRLVPEEALVAEVLQEPETLSVPASLLLKEKFGVWSLVGVVTPVDIESVGGVLSSVVKPEEVTLSVAIGFPTLSFTEVVTLVMKVVSPERLVAGVTSKILEVPEEDGEEAISMQLVKLSDVSWMLPLQVVSDVLTVTEELSMASEKVIRMEEPTEAAVAESAGLNEVSVGDVVSTTKGLTFSDAEFSAESINLTIQSL